MDAIELRRLSAEADYYDREAATLEAATAGLEEKARRAGEHASSTKVDLDNHIQQIAELKAQAEQAQAKLDEAELDEGDLSGGHSAPAAFQGNDATVQVVESGD